MRKNNVNHTVRWLPMAMLLTVMLTVSCKDHYWDGKKQMGLFMQWDDPYDDTTAVSGVHMWIFQTDGTYVKEYDQPHRNHLVHWPEPMEPGEYIVVATLNLNEPFYATTINDTRAQATTHPSADNLTFRLNDDKGAPFHAFYGVTRVKLDTRRQPMALKMHRILAELNIKIEGLSEGTIAKATVKNTAKGFQPALRNNDGSYGMTEEAELSSVTREYTAKNGVLDMSALRFMPVKRGDTETIIDLTLTFPDGTTNNYLMGAPVMEVAGRYVVNLKYEEMHSPMYLSAYTINPWTEGWNITGEILNPND